MPPQLWLLVAAAGYQPTARPSAPRHAERSSTAHVTAGATSSVALAFGDALAKAWQRDTEPLRQLLRDDAVVDTPIWSCEGAVDYLEKLGEAAEFFSRESPPRLSVLAEEALGPGMARVEWMLGVEWPAFWRARINVLGESVVRFELGEGERVLVRAVEETWHESPDQLFLQQVLPRRRDLMSLWNSPTAEHVPQRVERVAKGYELRRLPAMLAVQAETVETGDAVFEEQAPLAPAFAFTGEVKRTEWYSCVSPSILERSFTTVSLPGGMEQPGQRRRWILPLPVRFGMEAGPLPPADAGVEKNPGYSPGVQSSSVQYVRRPSQRLALTRLRGNPSDEAVLDAVKSVAEAARRDGLKVLTQQGRPVFMHLCYDIKNGFNRKGQLAMGVWVAQPQFLQENEVGVVLEED